MSPEAWREIVGGMIADIDRIGEFLRGMTLESFIADQRTVFAVCYAFVRLGEAVRLLPQWVTEGRPDIPWGDIRHFRNFMVHVYLRVDPRRLFETAVNDLPGLACFAGIDVEDGCLWLTYYSVAETSAPASSNAGKALCLPASRYPAEWPPRMSDGDGVLD